MGSTRKRISFEEETECTERRRSSRIVALEEKKLQEREKKLAQALEKKNNDIRNKGKGKAKMEVCDNNEEEEGPTKKRRKSKELYQLISLIKELGRHESGASETNDSSLNGMPLKKILEIIVDFLQRKDPQELFAEPVNPDVVEHYYDIIKQPMDFGTMRAKLHEGMYTDLEQFKCDIFLICSNAKNIYPETSKYHEVAEDISGNAKWIFEALSADPEHIELEFALNKKRSGGKPQNEQQRTSRRVPSKPAGRKNSSSVMVPETAKRDTYWPPSMPLVSKVLHAGKPIVQLNKNSMPYKESLLRFVEDLGPTVKRIAAKKLEALEDQQLSNSDTPTQNLLENVSGTQIIHQLTPQTPPQDDTFNAQTLALALPFLNRPLTIPDSAVQKNRMVNTTNAGSVNIRDDTYQGNKTYTNDCWNAFAASLLSNIFFNNDKGGSSSGIESSNERGTMSFLGLSKDKMVSPPENVSSLLGPVHEHAKQLQLGVNKTSNTRLWNTSTGVPNMSGTGSSSNVLARVYPTRVISGPQPKPYNSTLSGNRNRRSRLSVMMPQPISRNITPNINLPELSHFGPSRAENCMSGMPSNNLTGISPVPQPEDFSKHSNLSLVPQSRAENFMSCMPSNKLTLLSPAHQLKPEDFVNLSDLSHPRPIDSMYDMPSNNLTELSNVHQHQQWQADSMSNPNPFGSSTIYQPMQGESIPGTSYQPSNFQTGLNLSTFNNSTMQATQEQTPYTPPATYIGESEGAPSQLGWDNDQMPNLALQL
ncbi:uncharacterized protein LOC109793247 isoform X2 [Cajanus cajan]|uniref:uncharacterized protein LOC109793247 isoform X2 n=1 Tax=Cajanus cajan TaxID=3821 RepID=UPI0010FBB831|nr:uncharacterized protein LOC109793247 isoform X2 [Cajanus cajan]